MKKFFRCFIFAFAFVFGAAAVFLAAAIFLHVDVFGIFVTSATRVVGVFGDHFPILHTRFGEVQIRSHQSSKGQNLEIACVDCRLSHKLLATRPLTTSKALLTGTFVKKQFDGIVETEDLSFPVKALWESNSVTGRFEIPKTEIRLLYRAVRTIIPEVEVAQIRGLLSGKGDFSWPNFHFVFDPKIENLAVSGLVDEEAYARGTFDYSVENEKGERVTRTSGEGTEEWFPLEKTTKHLPAAIMAIEDRGFYQHPGYDLKSMLEASLDSKRGRGRRGASTLTQQLAKNLFLTDERTYARKLRELLYSVELEKELGKKRILELYINIVEWGPDIFGIRAAAQRYFNKGPSELLPEECAWLASILNNPKRAFRSEYLKNAPNSSRMSVALDHMSTLDEVSKSEARSRPLRFQNLNAP